MHIVIVGGHGKIALLLTEAASRRGDTVDGLVRDATHSDDIVAAGGRPVLADLENTTAEEMAAIVKGADAVVFAAGAGPGSGVARKYTVDRDGAVLAADAAERAGVRRFVQISSMGTDSPPAAGTDEVWAAYLDAKGQAEADLRTRDLDWTIVRPGRLVDGPGTGLVALGPPPIGRGDIPRADVAAVVAELLHTPATAGATLEVIAGTTPLVDAVAHTSR